MKKLVLASLLAVITTVTLSGCIKIYPQAPAKEPKKTQTTQTKATEPPAKTENTLPKVKETKVKETETTVTENPVTEATATQAEEDKNQYQKEGEHWAKEFSNPDLTDAERAQLGKEKGEYYRNKYGR